MDESSRKIISKAEAEMNLAASFLNHAAEAGDLAALNYQRRLQIAAGALGRLIALSPRQPQAERCTHGHRDGSFCHEDLPPSEPVVLFGEPATTPYPYQDKPACFKCGAPWREHYFNSRHCFSGADGDKAYWTYTQPPSEPCRDLSHTRILNDCQTCGKKVASPQPKEDAR